jgi:hypothetical protein
MIFAIVYWEWDYWVTIFEEEFSWQEILQELKELARDDDLDIFK